MLRFITIFGNLQEVKVSMETGGDLFGYILSDNKVETHVCIRVSEAIAFYYQKISLEAKDMFKNIPEDEHCLIFDEIEDYMCKRLYAKYQFVICYPIRLNRVFPQKEIEADKIFRDRCKMLDWVTFDHLEIIPRNRCPEMWEYAAKSY